MTNREIVQLYEGIVEIYQLGLELDIKTNYTLARIKVQIEPYYKAIMMTRQDLFKQYDNSEDNSGIFNNENMKKLSEEFEKLMGIEVELILPQVELVKLNSPKMRIDLVERLLPIIKD